MKSQKLFEEYFSIERAVISKCDEILAFFESISCHYYEQPETLVFEDESHLEQFNLLADEFHSLGVQEETLQRAFLEFVTAKPRPSHES